MQAIWVLAVLAVAAADVSHLGYHYKVPQTSYGLPSFQSVGSNNGQYVSGLGSSGINYKGSEGQYLGSTFSHGDHSVPSHIIGGAHSTASNLNSGFTTGYGSGGYGLGSNSGYGLGLNSGYNSGLNGGYISGLNSGYSSGLNKGFSSGLYGGYNDGKYYQTYGGPSTIQPLYLDGSSNQYLTSTQYKSGEKYQQYYQVQSQEPAQVFKHFYVHAAPEEPELPKPRTPIVVPPPQKHYKIIFVKTPNADTHHSQIVPVQPQNEEKTIVYVLVKKPEEHSEVIVPKVEQKPPTKPEVYFIKYNNKEDSQAVINNIVNDYNKPGQSVSYATGGSVGAPVLSGLPSTLSSGSEYSTINTVPSASYPSGSSLSGFSTGFQKYPSTSFSNTPSVTTFAPLPAGLSTISGSSGSSFSNPSSLSSGYSFTAPSSISSGSGFSSGSDSGLSSGFSSSSLFGSSQTDSLAQVPIVSSGIQSSSSESNESSSDAEASSGLTSTTNIISGVGQVDLNTIPAVQGLPHETYGVPKFRNV